MARTVASTRRNAAAGRCGAGFGNGAGRPLGWPSRLRRLLLGAAGVPLAASLLLSPDTGEAAQTDWLGGAGLKIRLVGTETRNTPEGLKLVATVSVSNAGDRPLPLWKTAWLDAQNPEGTQTRTLETRHALSLQRLPHDTVLAAGSVLTFAVFLPEPTAEYSHAALKLFGAGSRNPVMAQWALADLHADSPRRLSTKDLDAFLGRYRTNLGTLLTFSKAGEQLRGSSQTVGAAPDYAPSIVLRPESETSFLGQVIETGTADRSIGSVIVEGARNAPLLGAFTDGYMARRNLVACPVAPEDTGPWKDAQLRPGGVFWARPERLDARRLPNGKIRIDATIKVWNVSRGDERFELWFRKGQETADQLIPDAARDQAGAYRLRPCASASLPFWVETRIEDLDGLTFRTELKDQPWAPPWSLSEVLAKAGRAPGGGSAGGGGLGGGGSGGTASGPSSPTTELPGPPVVPTNVRQYANYGIWDFRIEELAPGPDGDWQAVVRVRDAATYRVGLTGGGVVLTLFDEDGRSLQSDGRIYRASVAGSAPQLEAVPQTLWMEKGDEVRVRLRIPDSRGFKPVRLRLSSGDRQTLSRTWAMN
jgi:hypothetical protein